VNVERNMHWKTMLEHLHPMQREGIYYKNRTKSKQLIKLKIEIKLL
jgi:hypothetical protein